jgi:hypothetical protein
MIQRTLCTQSPRAIRARSVIVLVGLLDDPVLVYMARRLMESSSSVVWLDQRALGVDLICTASGWQHLRQGWFLAHQSVGAVYNRCMHVRWGLSVAAFSQRILTYLLESVYSNVINRPSTGASNFSKLAQLIQLSGTVLRVPESVLSVGCMPPSGDWVFKSASNQRSVVHAVSRLDQARYGAEPVLYQQRVQGDNVRVHVFQGHCEAVRIEAVSVDYRYCADAVFRVCTLPKQIEQACVKLTHQLGLMLSGIDLIESDQGWTILEVNTSPGFDYFERRTGQRRLSRALVRYFSDCIDLG